LDLTRHNDKSLQHSDQSASSAPFPINQNNDEEQNHHDSLPIYSTAQAVSCHCLSAAFAAEEVGKDGTACPLRRDCRRSVFTSERFPSEENAAGIATAAPEANAGIAKAIYRNDGHLRVRVQWK
jgi:hypothetical protein